MNSYKRSAWTSSELQSSSWMSLSGVIHQQTEQMWMRGKTDLS